MIRCTDCYQVFTEEETENASCCPKCGSEGVPCDTEEDVTINLNWHELRILGIWADHWASSSGMPERSRKVLARILERLEKQHPLLTPLTLAGEIRKLQEEFPGAALMRGSEVIVPPKKVQ